MSEHTYTVRYHNPLMGTHETRWGTEREALEEARHDHYMNGTPIEVIDPVGNVIITWKDGSAHE